MLFRGESRTMLFGKGRSAPQNGRAMLFGFFSGRRIFLEITVNNAREFILGTIALAGEVPRPVSFPGINQGTTYNTLAAMKKDKVVKYGAGNKKSGNGDVIRLVSPGGLKELKAMNTLLWDHYKLMTNGHKFQSGGNQTIRYKEHGLTVCFMQKCGANIDNITLRYVPNIFGRNSENDPSSVVYGALGSGLFGRSFQSYDQMNNGRPDIDSMTVELPLDGRFFYTSKAIKASSRGGPHDHLARYTGIYLSGGNSYMVYGVSGENRSTSSETERRASALADSIHRNAYGSRSLINQENKHRTSQAIVIIDDPNLLWGILKQQPSRFFSLNFVYDDYYVIRPDETGMDIIDILSTPGWESKVSASLFGDRRGFGDGILNGLPAWEMITCNMGKAREIKKHRSEMQKEGFYLLCHEWQIPYFRKAFSAMRMTPVVLNEKEVRAVRNAVVSGGG